MPGRMSEREAGRPMGNCGGACDTCDGCADCVGQRVTAQPGSGPTWKCEGCGEEFDAYPGIGHCRAEHASDCDGNCRSCPVEVHCGPISEPRCCVGGSEGCIHA